MKISDAKKKGITSRNEMHVRWKVREEKCVPAWTLSKENPPDGWKRKREAGEEEKKGSEEKVQRKQAV